MPNNFIDIYTVGFFVLLLLAALHFKQASVMRSKGKKLMGIATVMIAFSLLLIKFNIPLYYLFLILAFILSVVGYGILMTKEKEIYEEYWKHHGLYGRVSDFFKRREVQRIAESGFEEKRGVSKKNNRLAIVTGIITIVAAVAIFFWRHEIIYPVLLVLSGIFYILMERKYGKKRP
jgi:chromate transport protein ChrA